MMYVSKTDTTQVCIISSKDKIYFHITNLMFLYNKHDTDVTNSLNTY